MNDYIVEFNGSDNTFFWINVVFIPWLAHKVQVLVHRFNSYILDSL